ncbi:MAG: hypothetical protein ACREBR_01785 [bacterium]
MHEEFQLGRALPNSASALFDASCKWINNSGVQRTFDDVRIRNKDVALFVQFYDKISASEYRKCNMEPRVFSQAQLLMKGFQVTQVKGSVERRQLHRPSRLSERAQASGLYHATTQEERSLLQQRQVWKIKNHEVIMAKARQLQLTLG